jgi:hypothetical protein
MIISDIGKDTLKANIIESESICYKEGGGADLGQSSQREASPIRPDAMLKLEDIFGGKLKHGRKSTIPSPASHDKQCVLDYLEGRDVGVWERNGLCVEWIALIAKQINSKNEKLFIEVQDQTNEKSYTYLKYLWVNSKSDMIAEENQLREILGNYEATRRINALRHRLYRYTLAKNWATVKDSLLPIENKTSRKSDCMNQVDIEIFENFFGLSCNPAKINQYFLNKALRRKQLSKPYKSALAAVFSKSEHKRWLKLNSYLANVLYDDNWWPQDFPKQCSMHGLDMLLLLKVGDALQLGGLFFLEEDDGVLTIDEAFSQVLSVMNDHTRPLPWIESPERDWLLKNYKRRYPERLKNLSHLALHSANKKFPLSIATIRQITNKRNIKPNYLVSHELRWCDLGWKLGIFVELKQLELRSSPNESKYIDITKYNSALLQDQSDILKTWHQDSFSKYQSMCPKILKIIIEKIVRKTCSFYRRSHASLIHKFYNQSGNSNFI